MSDYIGFCEECVYAAIYSNNYCECRRYPPRCVDGSDGMFPSVSLVSWCGEFKEEEQKS